MENLILLTTVAKYFTFVEPEDDPIDLGIAPKAFFINMPRKNNVIIQSRSQT